MWVGFVPSEFLFFTVLAILLNAITFFGVMDLVSISNGYLVRDDCSSVRAEEFYVSDAKGVWIISDVQLDCALAVGSFLKNFYATITGITTVAVEVFDTSCEAILGFFFAVIR